MKRGYRCNGREIVPVAVLKSAPAETIRIAKSISRIYADRAYADLVLEQDGSAAIEMAKRGRSLRKLAKDIGLSATYLSRVQCKQIKISLDALLILLQECEGAIRD